MKKFGKIVSIMLVGALTVSALSLAANAKGNESDDPTGFGVKDMSYAMAKIAVPMMNKVFDAANVLAGATEVWTCIDGERYRDLSYGERKAQKYDLYIPKGLNKSQPQGVLLFIHGGTWTMGEKEHMAWAAARYAKLGYITATMDYDLSSQGNDNVAKVTGSKSNADIFDMLDDVTLCISAIKDELSNRGYSASSLALSGTSAGSHISALYAYSRFNESVIPIKMIFNLTTPSDFHLGSFDNYTAAEVAQYASIVAGYEFTAQDIENPQGEAAEMLNMISPVSNIKEGSVPALLGFAGKDKTIGTNHANVMTTKLNECGVENEVIMWPKSDHTLASDPKSVRNWNEAVARWLEKYM